MKKKKQNSKIAFIKARPMTKSAQDVIAEAKAAGLEINANYVHSVRSELRRAMREVEAKRERKPFTKPGGTPIKVPAAKTVAAEPEVLLRAVASEIGLAKAIELLTNDRKSVLALLHG